MQLISYEVEMKLHELYGSLSNGELSNLHMAEEEPGKIKEAAKPKIVRYINDALRNLYSRFILLEKSVLIQCHQHITNYHLLEQFAVCYEPYEGGPSESIRYILDLPLERFEGDVIKIMTVYGDTGIKLPLNDEARSWSVFTPQSNMLQVPRPIDGQCLSIGYQARHPLITVEDENQDILVPLVLETAFTSYIAYKVFSHMNTKESTAKAQEHLALYEAECSVVEEKDLVSSSVTTSNVRFYLNGWI
jgi:hypothetical protein